MGGRGDGRRDLSRLRRFATVEWQLEAELETKKITFPAKQNVSKEPWQVAATEAACNG